MASYALNCDLFFNLDKYNDILFSEPPPSEDADLSLLQSYCWLPQSCSSNLEFIDCSNYYAHVRQGTTPHDLPHVDSSSQNTISLSTNSTSDFDVQSKFQHAQSSTSPLYDGDVVDMRKCGETNYDSDGLPWPKRGRKRSSGGGDYLRSGTTKQSTVNATSKTEKQKIIIQVRSQEELEDGYRWRKYGEKVMKNSSTPRCYYRCSDKKCSVKKRVKRHPSDPEILVVTYEGIHNHKCPNPVCYVEKRVYIPISTTATACQ